MKNQIEGEEELLKYRQHKKDGIEHCICNSLARIQRLQITIFGISMKTLWNYLM